MTERYLDIEFEIRKEKNIEFDGNVLKKIENGLTNFVEHEFENLLNKTKEEANVIGFDKDNFENNLKPRILQDKEKLKSALKRSIAMKDFELKELKGVPKTENHIFDRNGIKCFITGSDICTKKIEEKENQIFLAYDYKNEEVDKIIESEIIPIIKENGLTPIRAKDKIVNYDFMCKICEQIQESRFLLADISTDDLNVGLELGIAIGLQKITMIMADEKAKEIGDLKRTDSIRYGAENINKLKSDFSNMIENIIKSN